MNKRITTRKITLAIGIELLLCECAIIPLWINGHGCAPIMSIACLIGKLLLWVGLASIGKVIIDVIDNHSLSPMTILIMIVGAIPFVHLLAGEFSFLLWHWGELNLAQYSYYSVFGFIFICSTIIVLYKIGAAVFKWRRSLCNKMNMILFVVFLLIDISMLDFFVMWIPHDIGLNKLTYPPFFDCCYLVLIVGLLSKVLSAFMLYRMYISSSQHE